MNTQDLIDSGWIKLDYQSNNKVAFKKDNYFGIFDVFEPTIELILEDPSLNEFDHNPHRQRIFFVCHDVNKLNTLLDILNNK